MADPTLARLVSDLQSSGVRHANVAGNRGRSGGAGPSDHRALSFGERTVMVPVYNEVAARSDHQLETCGDGSLALVTANGERRAVSTPAEPHFYSLTTAEGVPYRSLALLHGRDVLATTLLQTCIRFRNREESCQFCAIEQSLEDSRCLLYTSDAADE